MLCDFHRRVHCQFNRNNEFSIAERTHKLPRTLYPFIHKTFPHFLCVSLSIYFAQHAIQIETRQMQPQQTIHQRTEVAGHTSAQRSLAVNSKMHDAHGTFSFWSDDVDVGVCGSARKNQFGRTLMSIERR